MAQPAYYGMVSSGSVGPDTALVQIWLNGLPKTKWPCIQALRVDGHFGSDTERAVKYFQIGVGLTADGKVGQRTWDALDEAYAAQHGEGEIYPGYVIKRGASGATVRSIQQKLNRLGMGLAADGHFGSSTETAVKTFQRSRGLTADGKVGKATWAALAAL